MLLSVLLPSGSVQRPPPLLSVRRLRQVLPQQQRPRLRLLMHTSARHLLAR